LGSDPETSGYEPKVVTQQIKNANLFEPGLDLDPKYVKNAYTTNIIQRTLARIVGQGPHGPVVAKCTEDGSLAVVQRGGAFDDYEREDHVFAKTEASRTTDGTTADHLIDSSENFVTDGILVGDTVKNETDSTYAVITAVANGDLTLDSDIMVSGESYIIIPFHMFTLSRQVTRVDIFTYRGDVDYQLSRDQVKPVGDKIPLFEDSFYSLDFYTQVIKATCMTFVDATPTRSTIFGWFREGG
jgi:hypothetical protein